MTRAYNFSAGPATLPESVLRQACDEMLDFRGAGASIVELSHRGAEFMEVAAEAEVDLRALMSIPDDYAVLFLSGGATTQQALIALNFAQPGQPADYVLTGHWGKTALKQVKPYVAANVAASSEAGGFRGIPPRAEWRLSPDAAYVHITANETIHGVEFRDIPETGDVPLFADFSSSIASEPLDIARYGLIYGGAQKNVGPAGVTMVVVRDDLIGQALPITPSAFDYKIQADNDSMFNTPPTYTIYIAGLVFNWIKAQGGLKAMEAHNRKKAAVLYDHLETTSFFYNPVARDDRSLMNVPFKLRDESLDEAFLKGAQARGMVQLKGHRSVGGMRASIYNAMPIEGVVALVEYMKEFEVSHG